MVEKVDTRTLIIIVFSVIAFTLALIIIVALGNQAEAQNEILENQRYLISMIEVIYDGYS